VTLLVAIHKSYTVRYLTSNYRGPHLDMTAC